MLKATINTFKIISIGLWMIAVVAAENCGAQTLNENAAIAHHPRLLWLSSQEKSVAGNSTNGVVFQTVNKAIMDACYNILMQPPIQQIKIGRRLLDKSRTCLLRVFYLSYAYRITREEKYLKRAEREMLTAAAFTDWNPTHFLDVGEMTMALSIGYDWLYDGLPQTSRQLIKEAILKKGLEPSLDTTYNSWLNLKNNWNQVCNAGITYGAIATYEDHPELSRRLINQAIKSIALPMEEYAPDGNYPEGYMYWEYGTSFNVMFIAALQSAFSNDFGLSSKPGFMQTPFFFNELIRCFGQAI